MKAISVAKKERTVSLFGEVAFDVVCSDLTSETASYSGTSLSEFAELPSSPARSTNDLDTVVEETEPTGGEVSKPSETEKVAVIDLTKPEVNRKRDQPSGGWEPVASGWEMLERDSGGDKKAKASSWTLL